MHLFISLLGMNPSLQMHIWLVSLQYEFSELHGHVPPILFEYEMRCPRGEQSTKLVSFQTFPTYLGFTFASCVMFDKDTMAGTVDARGGVVNPLEDRTVRVICALQIDQIFIYKQTKKKTQKKIKQLKSRNNTLDRVLTTRSYGWQNDGDPEGHQHHQNCAL